ncbi:MAG TPA: family 16 glycoside hydrolase [Prolixibacteraceae bacterium]
MLIKKILPTLVVLSLFVYFVAGYKGPKMSSVTTIDKNNIEKYWKMRDATVMDDQFHLAGGNASITSTFRIRNFELSMKMKTTPGAAGQLNFSTSKSYDEKNFRGYSVMINNSDYSTGSALKTGSLNRIRNNYVRTADDNEWFTLNVQVIGNNIKVSVNEKLISEYEEPQNAKRIENLSGMVLSRSFICLRKTGDTGELVVSDMKIKPLPGIIKIVHSTRNDSVSEMLDSLNQRGFPLVDYHIHLKGGLTMAQACQHARESGLNYGIAANCGLKFPVTNDSTLTIYLKSIEKEPIFKAMQCEGREWVTLFTPKAVAGFDYIFTDAMTWTDLKGRRMRLWMPDETFVENNQQFMDMLVGKIEAIMDNEPVDIYVNPTFLPAKLAPEYNELWTNERMDKVINALLRNQVALEINCRYKIPSIPFIRKAKASGVKFSFGTNNTKNDDINRIEYGLKVIKEVGLTPDDMFFPKSKENRKILKKGLPAKISG